MPYGRPGGSWAYLHDGAVTLRRTEIDVAAAIERIAAESGYPDRTNWAQEYVGATSSDADALTAMSRSDRGGRRRPR
jgi:hypothetical protein